MTITAKYAGFCAVCGEAVKPGDKIEWKKGEGSTHTRCVGKPRKALNSKPPEQMIPADADLHALAAKHGRKVSGEPKLRSFLSPDGDKPGDILVRTRKGTRVRMLVLAVGQARYYSASYLEDMDMFDMRAGRYQDVQLVDVEPTAEEAAEDTAKDARKARKTEVERLLRDSYSADTHLTGAPAGVTMTDLLAERRMAGSEQFLLGSDGTVYYMRSDYDMGPMWWRTSTTPELLAEAKALGVKP